MESDPLEVELQAVVSLDNRKWTHIFYKSSMHSYSWSHLSSPFSWENLAKSFNLILEVVIVFKCQAKWSPEFQMQVFHFSNYQILQALIATKLKQKRNELHLFTTPSRIWFWYLSYFFSSQKPPANLSSTLYHHPWVIKLKFCHLDISCSYWFVCLFPDPQSSQFN